jgi:hypothetical protein
MKSRIHIRKNLFRIHNTGADVIPTHLVLGEILFVVLVEEANLEDDIRVGNALRHVEVPQRVPHQHDVFPALKLRVVDCTLGLRMSTRFLKLGCTCSTKTMRN